MLGHDRRTLPHRQGAPLAPTQATDNSTQRTGGHDSRAQQGYGATTTGGSPALLDTMMNAATLAARWDTSTGHLANMRAQSRGPAYLKIGSRVLYRLADVTAWEDASRVTTLDGAA